MFNFDELRTIGSLIDNELTELHNQRRKNEKDKYVLDSIRKYDKLGLKIKGMCEVAYTMKYN